MNESFLIYVWRHCLAGRNFRSTQGKDVRVEHPGVWNHHAGPDFLNARVRIDDTLWAGNIEVHVRASDWFRHGHDRDEKYRNVILHVVMENDGTALTSSGRGIPSLDLSEYIPSGLVERYGELLGSTNSIPCHDHLQQLNWPPLIPWLGRLALERLERKAREVIQHLDGTQDQWENACHLLMFRAFGLPANVLPFEMLSRRWSQAAQGRKLSLEDTEALLLYLSGLLPDSGTDRWSDEMRQLGSSFAIGIEPIEKDQWSMLRMRPHSFPGVRIAQLAAVLHALSAVDKEYLLTMGAEEWLSLSAGRASAYWDDHFSPGRISNRSWPKVIGDQLRSALVANWISPYLAAYGLWTDDHALLRRAMALLDKISAEDNMITRKWETLSLERLTGAESQGLMELHNSYCSNRKCLQCRIGYLVLGKG